MRPPDCHVYVGVPWRRRTAALSTASVPMRMHHVRFKRLGHALHGFRTQPASHEAMTASSLFVVQSYSAGNTHQVCSVSFC